MNLLTKQEIERCLIDKSMGLFVPKDRFLDLARTCLDLMAQLEDAKAAQALVVEQAAEVARRHHSKVQINEPLWHDGQDWASDRIAEAIEALADPSGVAALAALRAEATSREMEWATIRDEIVAERDDALTRLAAAEAQVGALREALEFYADEKNYEGFSATDPCGCCSTWYEPKIHATEDNGIRARTALASAAGGAK